MLFPLMPMNFRPPRAAGKDVETASADETTTFHYDAQGWRDTVTTVNAAAGTTRQEVYGYDAEGRLDRIESPEGAINYGYNDLGRKTGMWTEKSATDATVFSAATYGYDELGRLTSVTQTKLNGQAVTLTTTYRYDAVGNLAATTLPNGTLTSDHYDDLNRLDPETITQGAQTLASYSYHLLPDGNRDYVIETDSLGGHTRVDWTYDVDGRLTRETRDEGNDGVQNGGDYTDTYTLDLVGNRLQKAHDAVGTANDETTTDTYNERDQLVTEDSTNNAHDASYTYDNNGSQITKTENGVMITYKWDLQNHLASIDNTTDGTADVTYRYNSDGIRVAESANGVTTYYLNDPQNPTGYAKAVEERTDTNADGAADTPATSYILGMEVIGQYQGTTLNYLLHDGHGSTRLLTDAMGNPVESYHYDAFGTLLNFTGTPKTNWQFGGDGLWDPNSLFTYHLARFRDRARFVSYDSFEADPTSPASLHKYLYASSTPVYMVDPSGHMGLVGELVVMGIKGLLGGMLLGGVAGGAAAAHLHIVQFKSFDGLLDSVERGVISGAIAGAIIGASAVNPVALAVTLSIGFGISVKQSLPILLSPNVNIETKVSILAFLALQGTLSRGAVVEGLIRPTRVTTVIPAPSFANQLQQAYQAKVGQATDGVLGGYLRSDGTPDFLPFTRGGVGGHTEGVARGLIPQNNTGGFSVIVGADGKAIAVLFRSALNSVDNEFDLPPASQRAIIDGLPKAPDFRVLK